MGHGHEPTIDASILTYPNIWGSLTPELNLQFPTHHIVEKHNAKRDAICIRQRRRHACAIITFKNMQEKQGQYSNSHLEFVVMRHAHALQEN